MANKAIYNTPNVGNLEIDFTDTVTLFKVKRDGNDLTARYMPADRIVSILKHDLDIPESEIDDKQFAFVDKNASVLAHNCALDRPVSLLIDNIDKRFKFGNTYISTLIDGWVFNCELCYDDDRVACWIGQFKAIHQDFGVVEGDFDAKVYATSMKGYNHFLKSVKACY